LKNNEKKIALNFDLEGAPKAHPLALLLPERYMV